MTIELYPFRYRDQRTGKWVRARYKAERNVIAERYAEWEITGPAEIHRGGAVMFSQSSKLAPRAHLPIEEPPDEPPPEKAPDEDDHPVEEPPPVEDRLERFLVLVFPRRYVTYCARRQRFAAMNGAARLYTEVGARVLREADGRSRPASGRLPDMP